jgi:hypothetical protein
LPERRLAAAERNGAQRNDSPEQSARTSRFHSYCLSSCRAVTILFRIART